ncbi:MAG: FadR family transcriptional regulator [Desulfobacteraceae bacterium]|nr:FadR family transcriptional regulator [Desulfobacteraceae bacterium]
MASFQKITNFNGRKKSSLVAEKILEHIAHGLLKEGERLPSERTIAEEMGVSRPPVREALSALQIMGVVESLTGDGTYVKANAKDIISGSKTISMLEENESPFEVFRARRAIESAIIEMAVSQAEPEDLENMRRVLKDMEKAIETHDFGAYFEANRRFHLGISRASHNSILVRILEHLFALENQPLWREVVQKHLSTYQNINYYLSQHQRMLEAIESGDRKSARALVYDHFDRTVDEVKRYL